jgi:hypothetical protein
MPMKKHKPEQIVGLQRSRDQRPDILPLEERVRRAKAGSSKTDEGTGERTRSGSV